MKRLLVITSVIVLGLITQATSCRKEDPSVPHPCTEVACTMMFAMVTVEVKDQQGNAVILDEHYTINENNGEKITSQSQMPESGTYTVLDDSYMSKLTNTTIKFRFVGKKNGVEIINEPYTISGDCCHVNKESGKAEIVIQ